MMPIQTKPEPLAGGARVAVSNTLPINVTTVAQGLAIYKHLAAGNKRTVYEPRNSLGITHHARCFQEPHQRGYDIVINGCTEEYITGQVRRMAEHVPSIRAASERPEWVEMMEVSHG